MTSRIIVLNSCVILVLGLLSIDLYNPALPEMTRLLNISDSQAQSLVVYYLAGFAFSQLIYGPVSDKNGRLPVILFSLVFAAVGNYLTSTAGTFNEIAFYRLLTGVGAGGCPVISRAILSDTFKDKTQLSKSLAIFSMASQVSPAFAPMIGGYITAYFPWSYNFSALSILLVLGAVFVKMTLPETAPLKVVSTGRMEGFKTLLSNFNFMSYSIVSAVLFAVTIAYFTASPFVFQLQFGLNSQTNGLLFIFYSAGIVIGSYLTKRLLSRHAPEKILMRSLTALLIFSAIMPLALLELNTSIQWVLFYGFFVALGCGLSSPLLLGISLHGQANLVGTGSALQGAVKMAGAALSLYAFSSGHTTTAAGLMVGIFIMTLVCFVLIAVAQHKAYRPHASNSSDSA